MRVRRCEGVSKVDSMGLWSERGTSKQQVLEEGQFQTVLTYHL